MDERFDPGVSLGERARRNLHDDPDHEELVAEVLALGKAGWEKEVQTYGRTLTDQEREEKATGNSEAKLEAFYISGYLAKLDFEARQQARQEEAQAYQRKKESCCVVM